MLTYFQSIKSENNCEINQNALHTIVTNAIDFMDNESDKYKKTNEDIKLGIYCDIVILYRIIFITYFIIYIFFLYM